MENQNPKIRNANLVGLNHVIEIRETEDGITIRTFTYHKTERQQKYGGYTLDKLIDTHEIARSK